MSKKKPTYIVFAGPNGAGKTTFYKTMLWKTGDLPQKSTRINPDELAYALRKSIPDERARQLEAGKQAVRIMRKAFAAHRSLNRETTLSGRSVVASIRKAYEAGYRVCLFYIGLESPELALDRIEHRVGVGGHAIDEQDVRQRYTESLINLGKVLDYCETALVFDNTQSFRLIASWQNGVLTRWNATNACGQWLTPHILDKTWHQ